MPMNNIPVVFISSTAEDLGEYRRAAEAGAQSARFYPEMHDYWVAKDNPPLAECLERVAKADVLVVVVAHRYGWKPPGQPDGGRRSITWLECLEAVDNGKEVLSFLVDDTAEWPVELREEYRLVEAARQGKATEIAAEVQEDIKLLGEFKTWLKNRGIRGTFVSREDLRGKVSEALREWRDRHPEFVADVPPGSLPDADTTAYLENLGEETGYIDIRGLAAAEGKAHQFPIGDLYIPLTNELGDGSSGETRLPLDRALAHARLVILGDPGSGKSTFLKHIANILCGTLLGRTPNAAQDLLGLEETPLPVLIRVADLTAFIGANLPARSGPYPQTPDAPVWLSHFLASQSRAKAWGIEEPHYRQWFQEGRCLVLIDGLDEAPGQESREAVSRLVQQAVHRWTNCRFVAATRPQAYAGDVVLPGFHEARIGGLDQEAVRTFLQRWSGALFSGSPNRAVEHGKDLVAAVESHAEIRRMARNPVMLTALAVLHWNEKHLPQQRAELYGSILTWLARSRLRTRERATSTECLQHLQHLAWAMQDHPQGRQVQVEREWAAAVLAPRFGETPRALHFLAEEEQDSGIVVKRGVQIRFWHLTFQEHLAAMALSELPDKEIARLLFAERRAWKPEWREVVLLLAGLLHERKVERVNALISAALDGLYRGRGARRVLQWMGAAPSVVEQARCAILLGAILQDLEPLKYRPADPRFQSVVRLMLDVFDPEKSAAMTFRERLEAAEALGQAGDPRLRLPNDEDYWVAIPGERFQIGRFPVTVEEYRRFVEAGGYQDEAWWKAEGFGKWTAPGRWDEQMLHPNWPVTEVSWYEAAAYCAWSGVRLATEAEWERAARGEEGREYPWGNEEPDPTRANYKMKVGHPTPVGLYPKGGTPEGVQDMAGNVWEWVEGWYDEKKTLRVLRGGSFFNFERDLRAALRYDVVPEGRDSNIGFRCVRELNIP
jgi:hypothetical protein